MVFSDTCRIINPSTKRILDLPHIPHSKSVCDMYLFQNTTDSYNVFSEFIDEKNEEHKFGLLHLGGQSNDPRPNAYLSWKIFNISEYDKLRRQERYKCFFYIEISKGILYILFLLKVGLSSPKIISFDLFEQQPCTILDVPDRSLHFNWREFRFRSFGSKPAVSFVLEERVNVWVLEDYKKQKWADTIQIPLPFLEAYPSWSEAALSLTINGKTVLRYGGIESSGWIYDPRLKQWSKIPPPSFRVRATLGSLKGMRPERKQRRFKRIRGLDGLFSWLDSLYMYY